MRATGNQREDRRSAALLAAGGGLIGLAALGIAWLALPSLFTERQFAGAGILSLVVLLATFLTAMLLPRAVDRLGVPISYYACGEAASMMLAIMIVCAVVGLLAANTSVAVLIMFACLGPRIALKSVRPSPSISR
ncbi:hypothetical protein [Sphingomonas faeni]|uniref:hypothetical protein n=1 Tax=Sphingomonas faeni TaxID=185950 RepID=UPI002413ADA2|nr:hypothetical protein [Sphingomonas faeni]